MMPMREITARLEFNVALESVAAYFARAPLAHAIFRASEVLAMSAYALPRPAVDLGCGTGEFASHVLSEGVEIGLDVCGNQLLKAERTRKYGRVVQADARRIPLPGDAFGTVLSVSALEHFADPEAVLGEVHRVLRAGGTFIGTVVLADLHEHLFYPRLLRGAQLHFIARWFESIQDRCFNHRALLSKEAWEAIFARNGLRLRVSKRIVSPQLTRWWDMLVPLALPGRLFGRHLVWRPAWLARLLAQRIAPHACAAEEQGSVLFFLAEKPIAEDAAERLSQGTATSDRNTRDLDVGEERHAPVLVRSDLVAQ